MAVKWRKGLRYELQASPSKSDKFFEMDWTDWLAEIQAATISTQAVVEADGGSVLTISNVTNINAATAVLWKVANNTGVVGDVISVDVTITTDNAQNATREIEFEII